MFEELLHGGPGEEEEEAAEEGEDEGDAGPGVEQAADRGLHARHWTTGMYSFHTTIAGNV